MARFTNPIDIKDFTIPSKVNKLNVSSIYNVEFNFSSNTVKEICVSNKFLPTLRIKDVIDEFTKIAE